MPTEFNFARLMQISEQREARQDHSDEEVVWVRFLEHLHDTHIRDLEVLKRDPDLEASVRSFSGTRIKEMHVVGAGRHPLAGD